MKQELADSGSVATSGPKVGGFDDIAGSALADQWGFRVGRVRNVLLDELDDLLDRHDIRRHNYAVLALACAELQRTQRQVASYLRTGPSRIVLIVDELESRGWVERLSDPNDRRNRFLVGTEAGKQKFAQISQEIREMEERLTDGLVAADLQAFERVLEHFASVPKTVPFRNGYNWNRS